MSDFDAESPKAPQSRGPEHRINIRRSLALAKLLVEYKEKLDQLRAQVKELLIKVRANPKDSLLQNERDNNNKYFDKMRSHFERLSRVASAQVAHGKLDSVSQVEIELRLAEFEASLAATEDSFKLNP